MKLKIASVNISGGFYGGDESSEYLDRKANESIDNRLLKDIIDNINNKNIDVICFQEIITTEEVKYIENIVNNTSLKHFVSFELSPCNLVKNSDCGLAILSKYPIVKSKHNIFTNPKLSKTTSSGNTYYTFDKGYLICELDIGGKRVKLLTHHGFPYRRFNSSPEENKDVFKEFDSIIKKNVPDFITGDFNAENFMEMMEYTAHNYLRTIDEITTVDGQRFDDILVLNKEKFEKEIIKSLSDHYIVTLTIEI